MTGSAPAGSSFVTGSTVYYRGVAAGSFQLRDTVADVDSGPASAAFNALTGTTTGWTHTTPDLVTTPAGGPYVSAQTYAWTAGTVSSPTAPVVGSDAVGFTTTDNLSFVNDSTAPTASTTFPTASSYNTAGWTGSLTGTAADAGSGVNAVKVSIQDTTVGGNSCWNGATFTAACPNYVAAAGTTSWSYALAAGALTNAHNYTATVETIDNVTNTNTAATTATWKYDTTPPVYASSATDRPGTHIDLTFTEAASGLNTGITPAASAFTVVVGGVGDTVTGVTMTDATHIRLTLTNRAFGNDAVTVAYTQPAANKVQDNAGNLLATFAAQTVTNTATAALAQSTVGAAPTSITANGSSTSTITVQLKNSAGTNLTLSGGVVTLSTTDGTFPGACTANCATTDNGDGTYTATLTSSTTAHNVTVSAKLDGSSLTNTQTVTFAPGAATRLIVTGAGTQTAGTAQSLTITAADAFGNTDTSYTGSHSLTFSGANSSTNPVTAPTVTNNAAAPINFGSATAITFANGVATVGGSMKLFKAESAVVAVTDGTISAAGADRLGVVVSAAAASKLHVTSVPGRQRHCRHQLLGHVLLGGRVGQRGQRRRRHERDAEPVRHGDHLEQHRHDHGRDELADPPQRPVHEGGVTHPDRAADGRRRASGFRLEQPDHHRAGRLQQVADPAAGRNRSPGQRLR